MAGNAHPPLRLRRLLLLGFALIAVLGVRSLLDAGARWRLSINTTDSLPNWAYLVDRYERQPARGELVAFVAPQNRWYAQGVVFAKIVAGIPGDRVERHGADFYVAGRFVGAAKPLAKDGQPTTPGPEGIIPAGRYFVVTPHPDSLDSRYAEVGWIKQSAIIGKAVPVL